MPPVEETGRTFEENAVLKAVAASRRVEGLVVADDSGLEVVALDGEPGVRSARYAGENATDKDNVAKLLEAMSGTADRRARFRCVLALAEAGEILQRSKDRWTGSIAEAAVRRGGFGYDPVFVPDGYRQTFAELGESVKSKISHRARAIAQLRAELAGLRRRSRRGRRRDRPRRARGRRGLDLVADLFDAR